MLCGLCFSLVYAGSHSWPHSRCADHEASGQATGMELQLVCVVCPLRVAPARPASHLSPAAGRRDSNEHYNPLFLLSASLQTLNHHLTPFNKPAQHQHTGLTSEPDASGFYTYTRPEGKSGGHGVGWSEVPRYTFKVPEGWQETPVSIADLGGTEVSGCRQRVDAAVVCAVVFEGDCGSVLCCFCSALVPSVFNCTPTLRQCTSYLQANLPHTSLKHLCMDTLVTHCCSCCRRLTCGLPAPAKATWRWWWHLCCALQTLAIMQVRL